ncbi:MAG: DUF2249 domain-containing protein [Burkholderiales bacterium]|nr:DUF2249 domain-containing protein [Burkholderiales bacterium]
MAGKRWVDSEGLHIDVRGLPPPEPLVAILALVRASGDAAAVIVHHERDPQFLYPELAEIGWCAQRIGAPAGEVRLRLTRRG